MGVIKFPRIVLFTFLIFKVIFALLSSKKGVTFYGFIHAKFGFFAL